jgi:predicted phosphodiesterase
LEGLPNPSGGFSGKFKPPVSDEETWEPFILPYYQKWGIISDIHVPYHSIKANEVTIDYLKDQDIKALLINGDFVDCFMLSDFVKDPTKRDMAYEIEQANRYLDWLDERLPGIPIYLKIGNHEERMERYLWLKAKELYGFDMFKMEELLLAYVRKMTVISDQRIIHMGKLRVLHGHEFGRVSGSVVNPARSLFTKTKQSSLMGHSHVISEHPEPDLDGNMITCWSTGCLSELHPRYARINKWSHGFAVVDVDPDGAFYVSNKRILDGRIF